MPTPSTHSHLADLPDALLWSTRTWADFAKAKPSTRHVALLPLFGLADWGLGRPLDLEETLGSAVLREALGASSSKPTVTVLPPLRFVPGPYDHCVFGLDFETALAMVREIASSVAASGVRKLVLFGTSPWSEPLMKTSACDLRAEIGLQTFCIHLADLGLDLHPVRSSSRTAIQCAACALTGRLPDADSPRERIALAEFRPGAVHQPGPLTFNRPLPESITEGRKLIEKAGTHLASLLEEIVRARPLANGGRIPSVKPPPARASARKARPA